MQGERRLHARCSGLGHAQPLALRLRHRRYMLRTSVLQITTRRRNVRFMNMIRPADVPNSTPRVRRLRARRSAPNGLRSRLSADTPAGRCRLALIDALAAAGLELGAAVDLGLQVSDTEVAIAACSPRYALLASNGACFASHPALLVSDRMPLAVFVDLSALVAQVEGTP